MSILNLSTLVPHTVLLLLSSVHIFAQPVTVSTDIERDMVQFSNEEPLDAKASNNVPMVHNDNYDMLAPDYYDQHPAESMQLQNFAEFYDPHMTGNNDLKMDESYQFMMHTPVRAPQPLSPMEKRIRQHMGSNHVGRDRKSMLYLMKGSSRPYSVFKQWDQFDYDRHSMNPGNNKIYIHG